LPSSANLQSIFLSKEGMLAHSGQFVSLGDNIIRVFYFSTLDAQCAHNPLVN
jgi:hypothetical protein